MDYNASSLADSSVIKIISSIMAEAGNASSVHSFGRRRRSLIDRARVEILESLNGDDSWDVIFCSGGTAANNLIVRSFDRCFVSACEHASILAIPDVEIIRINGDGLIDEADLHDKLQHVAAPFLVSIQGANSETGIVQNMEVLSDIVHARGGFLHSDMVQMLGKKEFCLRTSGIDALSLSGHKFGTPSGIGALVYRKSLSLRPLIYGGGQEQNILSGSENISMIVGLGRACCLLSSRVARMAEVEKLRDDMERDLQDLIFDLHIVGSGVSRLPNSSCLIVPRVSADSGVIAMDLAGFAVSAGSACSFGRLQKRSALEAMGYGLEFSESSIRVSLGCETVRSEVQAFTKSYSDFISVVRDG